MGLVARKPVFGGFFLTTQSQNSLRIRAVWSAPLLFTFWKVSYVNLLHLKFQFSVAEETGLKPVLSETPKTGFRTTRPKSLLFYCSTIKSWWLDLILWATIPSRLNISIFWALYRMNPCVDFHRSWRYTVWRRKRINIIRFRLPWPWGFFSNSHQQFQISSFDQNCV